MAAAVGKIRVQSRDQEVGAVCVAMMDAEVIEAGTGANLLLPRCWDAQFMVGHTLHLHTAFRADTRGLARLVLPVLATMWTLLGTEWLPDAWSLESVSSREHTIVWHWDP